MGVIINYYFYFLIYYHNFFLPTHTHTHIRKFINTKWLQLFNNFVVVSRFVFIHYFFLQINLFNSLKWTFVQGEQQYGSAYAIAPRQRIKRKAKSKVNDASILGYFGENRRDKGFYAALFIPKIWTKKLLLLINKNLFPLLSLPFFYYYFI